MKWFLVGLLCLVCSATWVKGDAAADLFNQGLNAYQNNQYDVAAKALQQILDSYPTFQQIDNAHILAGQSYFYAEKYPEAIAALQKEAAPNAKPEYRGQGLFLTALAQFYQAQKNTTPQKVDKSGFITCVATLTTLTDFIAKNASPDNRAFLEQALYFRSLANYEIDNYDAAVTDLLILTTDPQYSQSLSRPDYLLQLGDVYSIQASNAIEAKKSPEAVTDLANKAIATLDQAISDPNALIQANDAAMSKAQVEVMLATLNGSDSSGYQKALDAYRLVRRKADLITAQTTRLQQLRDRAAQIARANATGTAPTVSGNQLTLLISREQGKLDALTAPDAPDPIIDALIGIADCYINIAGPSGKKESDEARTILHRLVAHATLSPAQQKRVDFDILLSYVLGGQTDKATKALGDYLAKHKGDANASSISVQIAQELFKHKDYEGTLAQAKQSLNDFPDGPNAQDAITLEAQALTGLGRIKESNEVVQNFLQTHSSSPQAYQMVFNRGLNEVAKNNLTDALADFGKVKDATNANPELRAGAAASYIQTLQKLGKFDEVLAAAKDYEAKFPDGKAKGAVMLFAAQALDQKHDPGAVKALQDVARQFSQDPVVAPIALYSVVLNYQRANNLTLMLQAAKDLQATCPQAYSQILLADDAVSQALQKQRPPDFDAAAALYEPLTKAPDATVAAAALNKLGDVRFAQAKGIHYQSLQPDQRTTAQKILGEAESSYVATLKSYADQLGAVGDAIEGLLNVAQRNRSWGIFKDDTDYEPYLTQVGKDLTSPDMQARLEMAKAGLVFIVKNGAAQYPAALERFRKAVDANPGLKLTRQETDQYGELLLAAKDYDTAQKVYQQLLDNSSPNDAAALATGYFGLATVALAHNDLAAAKDAITRLKALPNGAVWFKHINEVNFDLAYIDELSGNAADIAAAKAAYAGLMKSMAAGPVIVTKSLLGYGRILEKQGNAIKPEPQGPNEYAIHYYQQPNLMFQAATPEQSAEGLYFAGQAYDKAGDKANAKKQYDIILATYKDSAPDWYAKAKTAEGQ